MYLENAGDGKQGWISGQKTGDLGGSGTRSRQEWSLDLFVGSYDLVKDAVSQGDFAGFA